MLSPAIVARLRADAAFRDEGRAAFATTKHDSAQQTAVYLFDDWFDPIEAAVRDQVRGFIEALIEGELDGVLARP